MPALSVAAATALAAAGPSADAGSAGEAKRPKAPTVYQSKQLWATVNVCDTVSRPDTIGVRASMPSSRKRREHLWMRFQVQYFSPADGHWHAVRGEGGDSGFVDVGPSNREPREAGRFIRISPKTDSVLLRGVVTFEWRLGDQVVRRARKRTTGGHRSRAGSDPPGYSAGSCTIRR